MNTGRTSMARTGIDRVRISLSGALVFGSLHLGGCDSIRKGTVNQRTQLKIQEGCADLDIQAELFAYSNITVHFANTGGDTLVVYPRRFEVSAPDFTWQRCKVIFAGEDFSRAESLRVPPRQSFVFYFNTKEKEISAFGKRMFESRGRHCDLDTLRIGFK